MSMIRLRPPYDLLAFAAAILIVLAYGLMAGCAGDKAREQLLAPTLVDVTPRIVQQAEGAEEADQAVIDDFVAAIDGRDWLTARLLWPEIQAWASQDIAARVEGGEIGEGVAESLRGRLEDYDAALNRMRGSP